MAKTKKINWKSKKTWKQILLIALSCVLIVGVIAGVSALFRKSEETTKIINPSYEIGGLTEDGRYKETDESIYTKDAFGCTGLDIELDFKSNISYRVFFYDFENDFLSSTGKLTGNYDETTTPLLASYCRIVITPNEDSKISWYEKSGYANQLTISVDKDAKVVEKKDITNSFEFTEDKAVMANTTHPNFGDLMDSTSFKASNLVDISRYVGKTLEITMPIYTTSAGQQANFGVLFYDEEENPIADSGVKMSMGLNSVEIIEVEIPHNATYVRTTYYNDSFDSYDYNGDFYALILM